MGTIDKAMSKLRNSGGGEPPPDSAVVSAVRNSELRPSSQVQGSAPSEYELEIDFKRLESMGILTPINGRSLIAEEMREIKRPVLNNIFDNKISSERHNNLVMITSALPGEGKSFTAINLAISIAMEMERTALLIDADVAKPSMMNYLGFPPRVGLVDYLTDDKLMLSDVMLRTNIPRFSVLPAGRQHHYATELLASHNMYRLVKELAERYADRVIIFDSPPLLATSEARVLTNLMGQILVVVEADKTTSAVLTEALDLIDGTPAVGLVLNKSSGSSGSDYYGGYGHYAVSSDKKAKKK